MSLKLMAFKKHMLKCFAEHKLLIEKTKIAARQKQKNIFIIINLTLVNIFWL